MDLEKLGHLMDEAKGGDIAFYLLIIFATICPGFMVVFTFKPELILSYDNIKLLLLCISLGGASFLQFVVFVWVCAFENGSRLNLRLTMVTGAIASVLAIGFAIAARESMDFPSWYFLWLGTIGAIISVVSGIQQPWYRQFFLNIGVLTFLSVALAISTKRGVWDAILTSPIH